MCMRLAAAVRPFDVVGRGGWRRFDEWTGRTPPVTRYVLYTFLSSSLLSWLFSAPFLFMDCTYYTVFRFQGEQPLPRPPMHVGGSLGCGVYNDVTCARVPRVCVWCLCVSGVSVAAGDGDVHRAYYPGHAHWWCHLWHHVPQARARDGYAVQPACVCMHARVMGVCNGRLDGVRLAAGHLRARLAPGVLVLGAAHVHTGHVEAGVLVWHRRA